MKAYEPVEVKLMYRDEKTTNQITPSTNHLKRPYKKKALGLGNFVVKIFLQQFKTPPKSPLQKITFLFLGRNLWNEHISGFHELIFLIK